MYWRLLEGGGGVVCEISDTFFQINVQKCKCSSHVLQYLKNYKSNLIEIFLEVSPYKAEGTVN